MLKIEKMVTEEDLIGALARAYCSKENSGKEVDATLIKAMVEEINKL